MSIVVDLFAGAGGWATALHTLNLNSVGIEIGKDQCATRSAAGHNTIRADLHEYPVFETQYLVASPPCTTFSTAGKKTSRSDVQSLCESLTIPDVPTREWNDRNSNLVAMAGRWVYKTQRWVILEQVPAVLPAWEALAAGLLADGWASASAGILDTGPVAKVPQTRKRAVLIACRDRKVSLPPQRYLAPAVKDVLGLEGKLGFPRKDDLGTSADGYRERDWRSTDQPAFTLTGKARSWRFNDGQTLRQLEPWEAGVLQTFPKDYPWRGSRTSQFQQIADAVPPEFALQLLLAAL